MLLATLAGCAAPPPTAVVVNMSATSDVNAATMGGQGAPVQLRVYQLASPSAFSNAEFFQLFNQDQATLGADLVKRDDLILAPGKTATLSLAPTAPVTALGLFAAYRNFAQVTWRAVAAVPAHKTTTLVVTAGQGGIVVKPGP